MMAIVLSGPPKGISIAPPGRRIGRAGVRCPEGKENGLSKKATMADASIVVAETPSEMGQALLKAWGKVTRGAFSFAAL